MQWATLKIVNAQISKHFDGSKFMQIKNETFDNSCIIFNLLFVGFVLHVDQWDDNQFQTAKQETDGTQYIHVTQKHSFFLQNRNQFNNYLLAACVS